MYIVVVTDTVHMTTCSWHPKISYVHIYIYVERVTNNLDPMVNYTLLCSGGVTSSSSFTTTDNIARSSTITTNLIPMTTSSSSVVTTGSVSSEDANTVMISTPVIMSSTPVIMHSTIDAASISHVDVDTTVTSITALNEIMTNTTTSDKNRGTYINTHIS